MCLIDRARRAAKEAKDAPAQPAPEKAHVDIKKFVKIGRPGYKVTKQRDPESGQQSLLFQVGITQGRFFPSPHQIFPVVLSECSSKSILKIYKY